MFVTMVNGQISWTSLMIHSLLVEHSMMVQLASRQAGTSLELGC